MTIVPSDPFGSVVAQCPLHVILQNMKTSFRTTLRVLGPGTKASPTCSAKERRC